MTERATVLVADDHPLFREGLVAALAECDELEVVATAAAGDEAVVLAERLKPDLVVMDVRMPGLDGIEATRRICSGGGSSRVLVLTMLEEDDSVWSAMRAGARGYMLKGDGAAEIVRAVLAVARGEAVFGRSVAERVLAALSSEPTRPGDPFPELSAREREVLQLLAAGHRSQDVAAQLGLSPKTVRNHVSSILTKLQVVDRAQAIARAREAGLG